MIMRDENDAPIRKANPMGGYGVKSFQFVVKQFDYEANVEQQIATKRKALMAVIEAKAHAEKAIQDRKTAEEIGKKNVAVAEYEAEVIKKTAVVSAQREKEVAELDAAKRLKVAELDAEAAALEKKAKILRAEGDAEAARKLIVSAGQALRRTCRSFVSARSAKPSSSRQWLAIASVEPARKKIAGSSIGITRPRWWPPS